MTLTIPDDIVAALNELGQREGLHPGCLVFRILEESLGLPVFDWRPRDEWERGLQSIGTDCGWSPPPEALTSDGLYD